MLAEQPRFNPASQELGELYISQGRWSDLEELAGSLSATNAAEASRLLACMSRGSPGAFSTDRFPEVR